MWRGKVVSFNKNTENEIESVDRESKNSEDAPPFDQPTAHTSPPPTVQYTAYTSPSFVQPTSYISSLPTDQPNAHASSPIATAPTNSHVAPSESVVDSDVESIDGGVEIGSDMDKYVDEELRGGDRNSLEDKLAGDKPFYPSYEAAIFETDSDDVTDEEDEVEQIEHRDKSRRRKKATVTKYVVAEHVAIKKYVNEPKRVKVRCTTPRLLYASIDSKSMNFVVKTYNSIHKCDPINRNKLCNTKFLACRFNKRIKEQPNIRIFVFQLLIKKELDLHVGRTVCRRAKNKVIAELMGDYNLKLERILDYRDELLRSNPGSTCVVKLHDETFEDGRKLF
ncbi:putative ADP-ribosylation factor GTPase-activating protein AGD14-like [Capsicum annuum]|nr:putative ADP-ribosylation factor GTPase-activating protein AGD14-like [Capsicum annuum]